MAVREPESPAAAAPETLEFDRIRYAKDAGTAVATVTVDRQAVLNCFDFQTLREMARAFEDASWDEGVAVVVVTGMMLAPLVILVTLPVLISFFSRRPR